MKYVLLTVSFLFFYCLGNSQTLLWSDDFEVTASNWNLTLTPGINGADANIWEINDTEGGVNPPGCGTASNGDKTLHVYCSGSVCALMGTGAVYDAGGIPSIDPTTDRRAALTNPINTTSQTNLELVFDWIGVGQANQDFTKLEYSIDGGTTWTPIWTQIPGDACTPGGQGKWEEETVALPVATENQPDLRFAFHWVNDNDGAGIDPSFAVNDLRLYSNSPTADPTADFTTPNFTICAGDCIDFTDASTGTNISSWAWTFNGSITANSSVQNPTNICFPIAGTYGVILEITDDNGTDSKTLQVTVNDCSHPNADFTTPSYTICEGDCINFADASTGTNISSWDWSFNGADTPTSNIRNPTNICYSATGSYNVTLKITDDNGIDSKTLQVIVNNCASPPTASFMLNESTVCEGDCISFTDLSIGNPTSWQWTFEGGNPHTSTSQNPSNICFDSSGVYSITLTVTNSSGSDQIINPVNVLGLPEIIGSGDTIIDMGEAAELEAVPIDPGTVYWTPDDNIDCPTCLDVIATPLITTTYYPTLTDVNGCVGRDTIVVTVNFKEIVEVPSGFSPNGDGINDSIHVLGVGITGINFNIYNRYGQLVFSTTNIKEGWGGTMDGKPLNQGVFAYTLEYDLINGAHEKKSGNITLIK